MFKFVTIFYFLFSIQILTACNQTEQATIKTDEFKTSHDHFCQREPVRIQNNVTYYAEETISDEIGPVKRFIYYKNKGSTTCTKQEAPLSNYENRIRQRARQGIACVPQPELSNDLYLRAANNYYTYRNGKYFLHLDPQTGIYRSVIFGEDKKDGTVIHSRKKGCFWMRRDLENEIWGAVDYGLQIYFDIGAGSETSLYEAIYRVNQTGSNWQFTGNDAIGDWDYRFCPNDTTPWGYCDLLRDGDLMFYPVLTNEQKIQLLNEALQIRIQYNFLETTRNEFESKWAQAQNLEGEIGYTSSLHNVNGFRENKYRIVYSPDWPRYTGEAWKDYIKGNRPMMPDLDAIEMVPFCYKGYNEITLSNGGTSYVYGEICYINGVYTLTN
jgi:hypothetical protein